MILLAVATALVLQAGELSDTHRDWLEEEVAHLITDREKQVFRSLPSEEDRERFIASFWEARDPTPGTRRNEFREEYEERRREADRLFRGAGRRGSRTERGRLYMMLGPPRDRRSFPNTAELWPIEVWFYQVDDPKLPPFFYVLFYQRGGAGDFRLWDPITEGPAALVASESGNPVSYNQARVLSMLQGVDTDLYQAVTAPVPGEPSRSSYFSYQKVLAVLEDYPNQSLNPVYADRYRPGEGVVETDFTFRSLELAPLVALVPSEGGAFVHFALEIQPENATYAQYRETYYTVFDLEIELLTLEDAPVYRIDDRREIEVLERDWERARASPLSLHGRIPVVPGEFRLRFAVRNLTGGVFDTWETRLRVPESIGVSEVFPARGFRSRRAEGRTLAFQFRETFPVPHPSASFRPDGELRAFLVVGPDPEAGEINVSGRIRREQEQEVVHEIARSFPRDDPAEPALLALEIGLGAAAPGDYILEIEVGESERRALSFRIDPEARTAPPLVNSPEEPPAGSGVWSYERARQYLALGKNREALAALESALERSPELDTARVQLAVLALGLGEPLRALEGIEPGLMRDPFHYELLTLAGFSSEQLGRWEDARTYYERAREHHRADEKLEEALARVYEKLGRSH